MQKRMIFPWDHSREVEIDSIVLTLPKDYDIMCALRGPDGQNVATLKWITTARIRYLVGMQGGEGGEVNRSHKSESLEAAIVQFVAWTYGSRYHWHSHIISCLSTMDKNPRFDQSIVKQIKRDISTIGEAV